MLWTWRGRWASGGNAACFSTVVSNLALRNRDRLLISLARIRKMLIKHALIVPPSVKYKTPGLSHSKKLSGSAEGGSPLQGRGVSPQKSFSSLLRAAAGGEF